MLRMAFHAHVLRVYLLSLKAVSAWQQRYAHPVHTAAGNNSLLSCGMLFVICLLPVLCRHLPPVLPLCLVYLLGLGLSTEDVFNMAKTLTALWAWLGSYIVGGHACMELAGVPCHRGSILHASSVKGDVHICMGHMWGSNNVLPTHR